MKSYRFEIGARARKSGRLVGEVRRKLAEAALERRDDTAAGEPGQEPEELAPDDLPDVLAADREQIWRQIAGTEGLTLRGIADLAWALNREVTFELKPIAPDPGQNSPADVTTVNGATARQVGSAIATSSTLPSPPQLVVRRRTTPG